MRPRSGPARQPALRGGPRKVVAPSSNGAADQRRRRLIPVSKTQTEEPEMRIRPPMTVALATATLVVAGGAAFAAVQSVATQPDPQVVIPTSANVTPTSSDDPAGHDANDDNGVDDPATHDANDDNGGASSGRGSDDPATHDANDDNGGASSGRGSDDPATHDANDDNGGTSSGSGADDPAAHNATD